ncbi:hypothetical protein BH09PSE5_BH09PSE5_47970 [soil metagenome]
MNSVKSFVTRHRVSLRDLSIILIIMMVAAFLAIEFDFYLQEGLTPQQQKLELDEALTLGALLAVSMLVFSMRRYIEQRREAARRLTAEQQVRRLAFQDVLTGLDNRRRLEEAIDVMLLTPPAADMTHALFMLDLNGFKKINDVHGHGAGDQVLISVAQRLVASIPPGNLVARLGGDEFVVLARHLSGSEAAANIARRIIQVIEEPIVLGSIQGAVSAGIGIALVPADAETRSELLRKADVALYRAKAERRGAFRFFEESMDRQVQERDSIEKVLRTAIRDDRLVVEYRPEIDLRTGAVVSYEAIARWTHPVLGDIANERLIAIAEDCGLIHEMSQQLMRRACAEALSWPSGVSLSIPISSGLLRNPSLHVGIAATIRESGLHPSRVELAIAESALVLNLEGAKLALSGLRQMGVKITADKFGTGSSSLFHLRSFGLDKIKIDRSFIESMHSQESSAQIVQALIGLGHGLGLTVTADREQEREDSRKPALASPEVEQAV